MTRRYKKQKVTFVLVTKKFQKQKVTFVLMAKRYQTKTVPKIYLTLNKSEEKLQNYHVKKIGK